MQDKLFSSVREIVNKYDPAGVIFDDETANEYDPEVKEILELLETSKSNNELPQKIHEIFIKYFDDKIAGDISKYQEIANEILAIPGIK